MAEPGVDNGGRQVRVSASLLLDLLTTLNDDARLRELLRGAPVLALSVVLAEGGPTVDLSPAVGLTTAERNEARALVDGIVATVAQRNCRPRPASEPGPRTHAVAARKHLDAGDPEKALQVVQEALERWPDSIDLHAYRALALSDLGQLSQAAEAFQQLIRRDPESVFAHASAAQMLARLGRWKPALAYAQSALALDPNDVASLQVLALANEHLGAYHQAADAMRRALELDPSVPNGAEDLARMEQAMEGDFDVSLVEAPAVQPATPTSASPVEAVSEEPAPEQDRATAPLLQPLEHLVTRRPAAWGTVSRPREDTASIECLHCGKANPARVSFCIQCGERLE